MTTNSERSEIINRAIERLKNVTDDWDGKTYDEELSFILRELAPSPRSVEGEAVGCLTISRFRGADAPVIHDFDYCGSLPNGSYNLYTRPAPAAVAGEAAPISMVLYCPLCGLQHIDKPEGQFYPGMTADESVAQNKAYGLWDNPPHRSHLCHRCGFIWRPADVPTNGVEDTKTHGKSDHTSTANSAEGKVVPDEPTEAAIDSACDAFDPTGWVVLGSDSRCDFRASMRRALTKHLSMLNATASTSRGS